MDRLTDEQLAALQALRAKMTAGPAFDDFWQLSCGQLLWKGTSAPVDLSDDDWKAIVATHNAADALIAEVLALRAVLLEAEVELEELGAVTVPKRIRAALEGK